MKYTLSPYLGFNEVRFGMTPDDVASLLGGPERSRYDDIMEMTFETRGPMLLTFTEDGLYQIRFTNAEGVFAGGVDIFCDKGATSLEQLSRLDPPLDGGHGGWVSFAELGISLSGFGKRKSKEGLVVVAFPSKPMLQRWHTTA